MYVGECSPEVITTFSRESTQGGTYNRPVFIIDPLFVQCTITCHSYTVTLRIKKKFH